MLDNRKKITLLVGISILSMTLNISTIINNVNLKSENKVYRQQLKNVTEERDKSIKEVSSLELKFKAQETIDEDEIKVLSERFLKSFYSYTYLSKETIYENIKPYSTEYLREKLRPKSSEKYNSDVDFVSTLSDVKLFYTSYEDDTRASILAISKHSIKVEGKGDATPLITQLDIIYTSSGWKVNDIVFTEAFENFEKF